MEVEEQQKKKKKAKRGRPGLIHHVSEHEVDVRGKRLTFKSVQLNLKWNCGRALKRKIQCIVFAVGLLHSTSTSCPPDIVHMVSVPRPSPFFVALPPPCTYIMLNANQRTKNVRGLEM